MKSLVTSTIFLTLFFMTSAASAAPCSPGNCTTKTNSFDGVRQYGGLGTKNWQKRVFDKPTKGWFRTEWNKLMAKVVRDHSCALDNHYPTLMAKVHWSEAYVDSRIKPTRAQARDPNWSNYVWNHPENGKGFVYDGITDALNDPLIANGEGIAKLAVMIGLTSTTGQKIPPVWMRKSSSLAWVEGRNQNGASNNWHIRYDNPVVVDHATDFMQAFLAKFGNNEGIQSIVMGEYYLGQAKYIPSGLNRDRYIEGVNESWKRMVPLAPRDADGNRIDIIQVNPLFNRNVTVHDLESYGIGISESDTRIDFDFDNEKLVTTHMKALYENEKVHVMVTGDARYACQGRRQRWDGTPNPFGHRQGYSGVATPQELFWYHGDQGPVPTHSMFLTVAGWCTGPQTAANFIDAVRKFGSCGTKASKWGASPAAFPDFGKGDVAQGKPTPPPAIAIK